MLYDQKLKSERIMYLLVNAEEKDSSKSKPGVLEEEHLHFQVVEVKYCWVEWQIGGASPYYSKPIT
jgi:hypothetical protein